MSIKCQTLPLGLVLVGAHEHREQVTRGEKQMPPTPGFLERKAAMKAFAFLKWAYEEREHVWRALQPAIDRAFHRLTENAIDQHEFTPEETERLRSLEKRRRRKVKGRTGRYGLTLEERLEVAKLLEKAYRDNPKAQWVLKRIEERLRATLARYGARGPGTIISTSSLDEPSPDEDGVWVTKAELDRLRRMASEIDSDSQK